MMVRKVKKQMRSAANRQKVKKNHQLQQKPQQQMLQKQQGSEPKATGKVKPSVTIDTQQGEMEASLVSKHTNEDISPTSVHEVIC